MDIVFLGLNDLGRRVYDWLCARNDVNVRAVITEKAQFDLVQELQPTALVSVGFDHLVPREILAIPDRGAINLHPSYLPHNRGKSPNVWSIVEDTPAGVTLHYMDAKFDTGEIIAQRRVETTFSDTGRDLHRRLERAGFELFVETWPAFIEDEATPEPQEPSTGTYHSVDEFRDLCELAPDETVEVQDFLDRLRALTFPPFNNAYIDLPDGRYYVDLSVTPAKETNNEEPVGHLSAYESN